MSLNIWLDPVDPIKSVCKVRDVFPLINKFSSHISTDL